MKLCQLFILLAVNNFLFFAYAQQEVTQVRYNLSKQFADPKQAYYVDVLELALKETTPDFGGYQLVPVIIEMPQGRTFTMVEHQKFIDVVWTMTSIEREQRLMPIRIPLLKGLMGYRIFIIRKGEQARFSSIKELADLQSLSAGQGHDWPDTIILTQNHFSVVQGASSNLKHMLRKKRFDYFPRAAHEPWIELQGESDLELEQDLLIKYAAPLFFFVSNSNQQLAKRLQIGLERAIANGRFDELFYNHEVTQGFLKKARINERRIFEIQNPLLSNETRALVEQKGLWLSYINY